jgi:hypothetical protein
MRFSLHPLPLRVLHPSSRLERPNAQSFPVIPQPEAWAVVIYDLRERDETRPRDVVYAVGNDDDKG